jgi:hypothetical protein
VKGQGFHWDGEPDQDYWQFNKNRSGKAEPKALYVYTEGCGEIYFGNILVPVDTLKRYNCIFWNIPITDSVSFQSPILVLFDHFPDF